MTVSTFTIPILPTNPDGSSHPMLPDLVEALQPVARARSTRKLIRACQAAGVRSHLILPMISDCPVDPATLGRTMRRALKVAAEAAAAGEIVVLEIHARKDAGVVEISAGPAAEVRPDLAPTHWDALPWKDA